MKRLIAIVLALTAIFSIVAFVFTFQQVEHEKNLLQTDLQYRSALLVETLQQSIEPNFTYKSQKDLQTLVEKFANREKLLGLAIFDNKQTLIVASPGIPVSFLQTQKVTQAATAANRPAGAFEKVDTLPVYMVASPLRQDSQLVGSFALIQNAKYIELQLADIWRMNLLRLLAQALFMAIATLIVFRLILQESVKAIVDTLKFSRNEQPKPKQNKTTMSFLTPVMQEISHIQQSLSEARRIAAEEARLRLEQLDSPWTAERLKAFVASMLKERTIVVVSNREPYIHTRQQNGNIKYFFPTSGMVTAIEPIMQACSGLWVAHGSGSADKDVVDTEDKIRVPPDSPKYSLRRVWLTEKEEAGYYYGFSNEGIWPLCHIAHARPTFRKEDWDEYKRANIKFAQAVLSEIKQKERPVIFVQDYLLALVPQLIKASRPDAVIGLFWHIPWPNAEAFSICPYRKELLDGILGSDLVGFHTQQYCNNFIDTVSRELEARIDFEQFSVTKTDHTTFVKPFPISIAFSDDYEYKSYDQTVQIPSKDIRKELGVTSDFIGLGVERLDYTKGILERLKAIEVFLEKYPDYRKRFSYIQIAAPSRSKITRYKEFEAQVEDEVIRINAKYKTESWKPIVLLKKRHNHQALQQFYQLANVCLVTSLHDGMNLVAKEYVAAREDEKGVLILSQFAGASRDLKDALIINPYHIDKVADTIKEALEMPKSDQHRRMVKLRQSVKNYNVYRWSAEILKTLVQLG